MSSTQQTRNIQDSFESFTSDTVQSSGYSNARIHKLVSEISAAIEWLKFLNLNRLGENSLLECAVFGRLAGL